MITKEEAIKLMPSFDQLMDTIEAKIIRQARHGWGYALISSEIAQSDKKLKSQVLEAIELQGFVIKPADNGFFVSWVDGAK